MAPYRRRWYRSGGKKYKWSLERTFVSATVGSTTTQAMTVIPSSNIEGVRKVKNITVNLLLQYAAGVPGVYWALYYLPSGMAAPPLNVISGSTVVEPNQNCIASGVASTNVPLRIFTPLARNLHSSDAVILLVRAAAGVEIAVFGNVSYAICYS